jgi:hypothetical protein
MSAMNKLKEGEYVYRGDKQTSQDLRGNLCSAVRRQDGKCIRGKNGAMLVTFGGKKTVIIGRLLRKNSIENSIGIKSK